MARSYSPRRRNRLPSAKCSSTVSGSILHHLEKGVDRLVGLLVEQEIQAPEVRARQGARFGEQMLDVDACGQPAQPEEQRDAEQPPELELHRGGPLRRR